MDQTPADDRVTEPRQRLLLAAEEVFARKGYEGATVREICDRAGMNVAAINYHFGDKETLYIDTVRNAHACSKAGPALLEWSPGTPPAEKLRQFIGHMTRSMNGPIRPESLQLLMRELGQPSPATVAVVQDYIRPMAYGLTDILTELLPDLPEPRRLMIGFSVVGQCLYYRQNRTVSVLLFGQDRIDELSLEMVTDHITRCTFAALGLADAYPHAVRTEGAV